MTERKKIPNKKGEKKPEKINIETLKKEIEDLNKIIADKEDKILRSYADFQNYQKRIEKELQFKEEEIRKKYISELIEVNELLKKLQDDCNPIEGVKSIIQSIENFFNTEKIKVIECVGKQFDHTLHHAVSTIEKENCEDNIIIEEVKKGYLIDDKPVLPSKVIVAKKKQSS